MPIQKSDLPRVLFITPCAFNAITGGGVTFTNLFRGWPKDKLATATGDTVPVTRDVCENYFFLSQKELDFIAPFDRLYPRRPLEGAQDQPNAATAAPSSPPPWIRVGKKIIGDAGIPDRGRMTPAFAYWIKEFSPQVIYTILGSTGYIDLVEKALDLTGAKLAVHLMDDGVTSPRRKGLFGPYQRFAYGRRVPPLLEKADCAMAICPKMAKEYAARYGRGFSHFQNTVDAPAWFKHAKDDLSISGVPRLVYAGSIFPYAQRQSLIDCCHAVDRLNSEGFPVTLDIYSPKSLLGVSTSLFTVNPAITFHDALAQEPYRRELGRADVLLLPVNFDVGSLRFIRLSMPTKVPEYLASGTPVLVYGPFNTAQTDYAVEKGWGAHVGRQNIDTLMKMIKKMVRDMDLRKRLSASAKDAVIRFHDIHVVRDAFQNKLAETAPSKATSGKNV